MRIRGGSSALCSSDLHAPLLIKSNRLSSVHRRVLLDLVVVPELKGKKVERLSIHAGLWTSQALSTPPAKVPVLRAQLEALMAKFGFDPTGHAGKALAHALTALPHDLLIADRKSTRLNSSH